MNRTQILNAKQIQQKLFHLPHGNENCAFFPKNGRENIIFFANLVVKMRRKNKIFEMKIS